MPRDKITSKRKRSSSRKRRRTVQKFTFFNEPVIQTNFNKPKYTQRGIKYPLISRIYDAKRFRISKVLKIKSNAYQKGIQNTAFITFWDALDFDLIVFIFFLFRTSHGQLVRFIRPLLAGITQLNLTIQLKGNIICNVIIKVTWRNGLQTFNLEKILIVIISDELLPNLRSGFQKQRYVTGSIHGTGSNQ